MRLVLRQPSPSWHTFHVEEIRVFAEPPRRVRRQGLAPPQAPLMVPPLGRPASPAQAQAQAQGQGPAGEQRPAADVSILSTVTAGRLPG